MAQQMKTRLFLWRWHAFSEIYSILKIWKLVWAKMISKLWNLLCTAGKCRVQNVVYFLFGVKLFAYLLTKSMRWLSAHIDKIISFPMVCWMKVFIPKDPLHNAPAYETDYKDLTSTVLFAFNEWPRASDIRAILHAYKVQNHFTLQRPRQIWMINDIFTALYWFSCSDFSISFIRTK